MLLKAESKKSVKFADHGAINGEPQAHHQNGCLVVPATALPLLRTDAAASRTCPAGSKLLIETTRLCARPPQTISYPNGRNGTSGNSHPAVIGRPADLLIDDDDDDGDSIRSRNSSATAITALGINESFFLLSI